MFRILSVAVAFALCGCNQTGSEQTGAETVVDANSDSAQDSNSGSTPKPTPTPTPTTTPTPPSTPGLKADVLIFYGNGVDDSNAQILQTLVQSWGYSHHSVTSAQLNSMTLDELALYRVIVWPGGDSDAMSASLTKSTRENVRRAVVERGVGYTGFCAGAWMAVGQSTPQQGGWGLGLIQSAYLSTYRPDGKLPTAAMVEVTFADASRRELVWWGGPALPERSGGVIARYKDGVPAIGQAWAGKGFVTISGPHPEAPQSWRTVENLSDNDGLDYDVARNLIEAALTKNPLGTF